MYVKYSHTVQKQEHPKQTVGKADDLWKKDFPDAKIPNKKQQEFERTDMLKPLEVFSQTRSIST